MTDGTLKKPEAENHKLRSAMKALQARLNAIKLILDSVPYERLDPKLDFVPNSRVLVSGSRELEIMEAQLLKIGKFTH